jgi:hypothetical protein
MHSGTFCKKSGIGVPQMATHVTVRSLPCDPELVAWCLWPTKGLPTLEIAVGIINIYVKHLAQYIPSKYLSTLYKYIHSLLLQPFLKKKKKTGLLPSVLLTQFCSEQRIFWKADLHPQHVCPCYTDGFVTAIYWMSIMWWDWFSILWVISCNLHSKPVK